MSAVEPARHALYSRLEEVLGDEHAETLMTHLPQHPADQVATEAGLADLKRATDVRFDRLEERFDRMVERFDERLDMMMERMDQNHRFYVGVTLGAMTGLTAIFSVVVHLIT